MAGGEPDSAVQKAGERIGEVAREVADRGGIDLQALLGYRPLEFFGLEITVGGIIAAALALFAAWMLSALIRRSLKRYGSSRENVNRAALYTVSRVVHYVVLAIGALIALELAGIPISKLSLFAGALGVGLGFGLQAIFSNFVSGLILLFDRSLKVGDFVELESGIHGEVRDIKIRATRITTNDNIDILVPNSEFVSGRVTNWTLHDGSRRMRIPFGVGYGASKDLVKQAALEAAADVPFTIDLEGRRRPQVWLVEFGDSSLNFELVVWLTAEATKRPSAVKAAYLWALHTALQKHGIEIPFPQRDLNLRSLFGREGDDALDLLRALLRDGHAPAQSQADALARDRAQAIAGARETDDTDDNDAARDVQRQIAEDAAAPPREAGDGAPDPSSQES